MSLFPSVAGRSRYRSFATFATALATIFAIGCAPSPADTAPTAATPPATVAQAMQPYVDNNTVAGLVLLTATKDKVLDITPVGYADIASKTPMKADTEFWIASMTKAMTATAFMTLVDAGKIGLDDPVSKYIPEFATDKTWPIVANKNDKVAQPPTATHDITVREILSHSAGLGFSSPFERPTLDVHSLADRVVSYTKMPLIYDPGSEYSYSNAGINTAGRIIEVVSGEPYAQYMQEHVFDPLQMTDTTFAPTKEQIARLATSYQYVEATNNLKPINISQLKYPLDDPSRQPMPAGGLFSTASDVAKFCQMLLRGGTTVDGKQLISQSSVAAMTTKETPSGVTVAYGFGLGVGATSFGHAGAYGTSMNVDKKHGIIRIYMIQQVGGNREEQQKMQNALGVANAHLVGQP